MSHMFTQLTTTQDSLYDILNASYALAFAAYHPWLIKKASVLAIYAAGTREQLTQSMNIKDFSELNNIAKFLVGLREALAKFYTDSGMADLP